MWNTKGECMNRTSKSFFPSAGAAALTLVSSLVVPWFPSSLDSGQISGVLILLPLLIHPQLFHRGEHFPILAHIKTSIEHQIISQQIVYDSAAGQGIRTTIPDKAEIVTRVCLLTSPTRFHI